MHLITQNPQAPQTERCKYGYNASPQAAARAGAIPIPQSVQASTLLVLTLAGGVAGIDVA